MEKNPLLYLYLHIPRTGGTTFQWSVGHPGDKENDRHLAHYLYVDSWSETAYEDWLVPTLSKRTKEQQQKLKIMSGHSLFCNSHRWLREKREPRYIATVRHPIERLLSDFNYRYVKQHYCQDPALFSRCTPRSDEHAIRQKKNVEDYDTLYEFYQDNSFQHNIQCKWIVKSFLTYENDTWKAHKDYIFGPDTGIANDEAIPMTWPEWCRFESGIDWYEFVQSLIDRMWWIGTTETLEKDLPAFCKHAGLENTYKKTNESKLRYWTMDDVRKQPDINKLIKAEQYDMKLYEYAKTRIRPF